MRLFLLAALLVSAAAAVSAGEESAPATSAGTAKDAGPNAHLAAAVRLYQKLDLDAAIAELQLAEDGAKDSEDDRVQVLIYRGLIYSETGKLSAASDQFKRAPARPADRRPARWGPGRRAAWEPRPATRLRSLPHRLQPRRAGPGVDPRGTARGKLPGGGLLLCPPARAASGRARSFAGPVLRDPEPRRLRARARRSAGRAD